MNLDKAKEIKGYMFDYELEWLAEQASKHECIVEIGTFYGRSARALADNTSGRVYCIDPYPGQVFMENNATSIVSGNYVHRQAQRNLADHIESGRLSIHRGTVNDFPHDITPDFIFIDGDHKPGPFTTDLVWSLGRLKKNGLLSGHDYANDDWPSIKKIVDEQFPQQIGRVGYIWWRL